MIAGSYFNVQATGMKEQLPSVRQQQRMLCMCVYSFLYKQNLPYSNIEIVASDTTIIATTVGIFMCM